MDNGFPGEARFLGNKTKQNTIFLLPKKIYVNIPRGVSVCGVMERTGLHLGVHGSSGGQGPRDGLSALCVSPSGVDSIRLEKGRKGV